MTRLIFGPKSARSLRGRVGRWTVHQDALVPALELRVSPRGTRSWSVRCRVGGRRVRVSLGNVARVGLKVARAQAREVCEQAAAGQDPRRTSAGRLSVAALGQVALDTLELRPSTRTEWERLLKAVVTPGLGSLPADQLDRHTIRRWVGGIRSRSVARHAFAFLRRCYSWAVGEDLLRATPFVELRGPEPLPSSTRVLSTDELRWLWQALDTMELLHEQTVAYEQDQLGWNYERPERAYIDATRLLILTAARREMVVGMRRSEFEALKDPARARWIVPAARMKGGRDHVVPLSPQALATLKRRLAATKGELLFPAGRGAEGAMTWSSRFVRDLVEMMDLIAERELPAWTIHNLRHTAATHMAEDLGVSTEIISLILAHRPPGAVISRIYNRAERLAERRDALNRWAAWVEGLIRP